MSLTCLRCGNPPPFPLVTFPGCYCVVCREFFDQVSREIVTAQNPRRGIHADGKFAATEHCPKTFDKGGVRACGLCGSVELDDGYGHTGYGLGGYTFCCACHRFLDFAEDSDE
jgi:hypothetical protein